MSKKLGQPGVRGVHVSKPLKTRGAADVDADPAGPGPVKPLYDKAAVQYGPAQGEKECAGCRFFYRDGATGMCRLVQGDIDADGWCQLYSPIEVEDLERDDKPKPLTEAQLTKFFELKDMRLDDVQGTRRSWVPIFPEGVFQHPEYGTLDFSLPELKKYVLHFRQRVRKIDIAVDIDHKNEEAVGWLKDLDLRPGVGLFGLVEWNQHGAGMIADKRYRYISPQFGEYVDEESGETYDSVIVALTITNFPFLKSMAAIALRKKEGGSPVTGVRMATKLKAGKATDKAAAEDEELDATAAEPDEDDEPKAKKAKKAVKAKKADDENEDMAEGAEAAEASELDDDGDEDESASEQLYDKDDAIPASKAKEPRSERERRLMEQNRAKDRRLSVLEEQMKETNRILRLSAVREQTRRLTEPMKQDRDGKQLAVAFTKPVITEFRALALADKKAGDALFRILSIVRKDGLVTLSTEGRADDPEDESNDPTGHGTKVLRDKKSGKPLSGVDDQRKAQMYAKEHKLDWNDLEDRQKSYLATMYGDGTMQLSDDGESGYGREES